MDTFTHTMHDHWEDGAPTYVQVEAERLIEHPNCTSQRGEEQ